jgi:hypothetical protein
MWSLQVCNPSSPEAETLEDPEFQASMGYIARPCFKRPKKKKRRGEEDQRVINS